LGIKPFAIHLDNGGEFENAPLHDFLQHWNVALIHGKSYTPREQGKQENWNKTFETQCGKVLVDYIED
jgi:hypothetical protein